MEDTAGRGRSRGRLSLALLALAALGGSPRVAAAASFELPCDVTSGFDFTEDVPRRIGVVTRLRISGVELARDLVVRSPLAPSPVPVVGVMQAYSWAGGVGDPIAIVFQVSRANRQELAPLAEMTLADPSVAFAYTIQDYDPDAHRWFDAARSEGTLVGRILAGAGTFAVAADPSLEVPTPENYEVVLAVAPPGGCTQEQTFRVAADSAVRKMWGLAVAGEPACEVPPEPDDCPDDPAKTAPGLCGCGVSDADSDGDGAADCDDACPGDAGKVAAGICGCGVSDADSDGDGAADCDDACPADATKIGAGSCGCGVADTDSDGDGVPDCDDETPDGGTTPGEDPGGSGCSSGATGGPAGLLVAALALAVRRRRQTAGSRP